MMDRFLLFKIFLILFLFRGFYIFHYFFEIMKNLQGFPKLLF